MVKETSTPTTPHRVVMTPAASRALRAAERLFYEHGIHAVGVDLIAAEAHVTKKTLYDRFGSKEQLVVEYLADRDERWRAFLAERLATAALSPAERILAVFDASAAWAGEYGSRGCSMINAHAEIGDPAHPAYSVITGQKHWMLELFTEPAIELTGERDTGEHLGRSLLLLHEGALTSHGLAVFADPLGHARAQAAALLTAARPSGRLADPAS
jgi:AcrR family transcriptional regulator